MRFPKSIAVVLGKVLLDLLMSPVRTDELVKAFADEYASWRTRGSPPASQKSKETLESTMEEALRELLKSGSQIGKLDPGDIANFKELFERVESKLDSLPVESISDPSQIESAIDEELPGVKNTYVIWLEHPELIGSQGPRYFHFTWETKHDGSVAFRLRDYIGKVIYHQRGVRVNERPFVPQPLDMTAQEIWRLSDHSKRIPRTGGLSRPLGQYDFWLDTLRDMTAGMTPRVGSSVDPPSPPPPAAESKELPGSSNTYIIWLDHPPFIGSQGPRYFHFTWETKHDGSVAFRLRDYIGKVIYHQRGVRVNEQPFTPKPLDMTAQEIWRLSDPDDWHPGTGELRVKHSDFAFWSKKLSDMTQQR